MVISMAGSMFMPSPPAQMQGSSGAADIKISTPGGDVQISTTPADTNAPSETKVIIKTPEGEVKVVAESMQDMIKRLEILAAEQEKAGTK
jgi:hypothetical protein